MVWCVETFGQKFTTDTLLFLSLFVACLSGLLTPWIQTFYRDSNPFFFFSLSLSSFLSLSFFFSIEKLSVRVILDSNSNKPDSNCFVSFSFYFFFSLSFSASIVVSTSLLALEICHPRSRIRFKVDTMTKREDEGESHLQKRGGRREESFSRNWKGTKKGGDL